MRRSQSPGFLHSLLALSLFVAIASPAFGQTERGSVPGAYDITKEVTLRGIITQVVPHPAAGLPLGLHLMVTTAGGTVDVHLGPYMGRTATAKGLVAGAAIQMTGVTKHYAAGDVLLARILVANEQTITVRNDHGFPLRPLPATARTAHGTQSSGGL